MKAFCAGERHGQSGFLERSLWILNVCEVEAGRAEPWGGGLPVGGCE